MGLWFCLKNDKKSTCLNFDIGSVIIADNTSLIELMRLFTLESRLSVDMKCSIFMPTGTIKSTIGWLECQNENRSGWNCSNISMS